MIINPFQYGSSRLYAPKNDTTSASGSSSPEAQTSILSAEKCIETLDPTDRELIRGRGFEEETFYANPEHGLIFFLGQRHSIEGLTKDDSINIGRSQLLLLEELQAIKPKYIFEENRTEGQSIVVEGMAKLALDIIFANGLSSPASDAQLEYLARLGAPTIYKMYFDENVEILPTVDSTSRLQAWRDGMGIDGLRSELPEKRLEAILTLMNGNGRELAEINFERETHAVEMMQKFFNQAEIRKPRAVIVFGAAHEFDERRFPDEGFQPFVVRKNCVAKGASPSERIFQAKNL